MKSFDVRYIEVQRLRQMANEAASRGDIEEARKLDVLADNHAQKALLKIRRKRPRQMELEW